MALGGVAFHFAWCFETLVGGYSAVGLDVDDVLRDLLGL